MSLILRVMLLFVFLVSAFLVEPVDHTGAILIAIIGFCAFFMTAETKE